jgi:hypothetical protein
MIHHDVDKNIHHELKKLYAHVLSNNFKISGYGIELDGVFWITLTYKEHFMPLIIHGA